MTSGIPLEHIDDTLMDEIGFFVCMNSEIKYEELSLEKGNKLDDKGKQVRNVSHKILQCFLDLWYFYGSTFMFHIDLILFTSQISS